MGFHSVAGKTELEKFDLWTPPGEKGAVLAVALETNAAMFCLASKHHFWSAALIHSIPRWV